MGFCPLSKQKWAAGNRWSSGNFPGEDVHPPHARAWGAGAPLKKLMEPLRPGEESAGQDNRFAAYAVRLWLPLLKAIREGR